MKKTILLGSKGTISNNVSKWIFGILGLLYIVLGSKKIYEQGVSFDSIGHLIIAFVFLLYSIIVFSVTPLTPKMRICDNEIEIKRKIFSSPIKILWTNIQSIEFNQYMIVFHLTDRVEEFNYSSNAETSIEIKSSIREVSEKKNIQVTGG
jgi:hypothetical protein